LGNTVKCRAFRVMNPRERGRFLAIVAHCGLFVSHLWRYCVAIVAPLWSGQVPQFGSVKGGPAGMGSEWSAKLLARGAMGPRGAQSLIANG
jgi:hypothetical protein